MKTPKLPSPDWPDFESVPKIQDNGRTLLVVLRVLVWLQVGLLAISNCIVLLFERSGMIR